MSQLTRLQADARYVQPGTSPSFTGVTATAGGAFTSVGYLGATLRSYSLGTVSAGAKYTFNVNAALSGQDDATSDSWIEAMIGTAGTSTISWLHTDAGAAINLTVPALQLNGAGTLVAVALAATGATGLTLGTDATTAGYLKLWSSAAGHYYTSFTTSASQTASASYTLPTAIGAGCLRDAAGNGTLSWVDWFDQAVKAASNVTFNKIHWDATASATKQNLTPSSNALAIDMRAGNKIQINMTENATISFSNAPADCSNFILKIIQDATGSRVVTWPTMKWPGGTAFVLSTAANAVDIVSIYYDGTNYNAVGNSDFK